MKYSLSGIMQDAWKNIRNGMGKSEAMKQAWKAAKASLSYWKWKPYLDHKRDILTRFYPVESHDIENELWIWFNEIMQKYDARKSCVYTYLQNQFRGFETDMKRKNEKTNRMALCSFTEEVEDPQREKFEDIISFYLEADKRLSDNAKQVLQFVFESELSLRPVKDPSKRVSRNAAIRYFNRLHGWTVSAVKAAWEEIRVWWREFEYV